MYIYVLTSGDYSGYHIEGVVTSETPINWIDARAKITAWLNENIPDQSWYLEEDQLATALKAAGLSFAEYQEVTYEPRWQDEGNWHLIEGRG